MKKKENEFLDAIKCFKKLRFKPGTREIPVSQGPEDIGVAWFNLRGKRLVNCILC
jgi:hypothetical protein